MPNLSDSNGAALDGFDELVDEPWVRDPVEVLVVGGGHAGIEAATAAARLGRDTLLVTGAIDRIGAMSCNPAVGGVGKGHLVRELDALGGVMGELADATGIHFRTLNESRGPAVRAPRCQSDMARYQAAAQARVSTTPGLSLLQAEVVALVVEDGRVTGVRTGLGQILRAGAVVLTTGTFLGGLLHRGRDKRPGGRAGEAPGRGLSEDLRAHGLDLLRLKTGTCPRIDARTVDLDSLEEQEPDDPAPRFGLDRGPPPLPQVSCRLTWTTARTHEVITRAVERGLSPLYAGAIGGAGPRYCPSIEDKVLRFADKDRHQVFLEPHGLDTVELYPNGLSTSLPPRIQLAFLRTIPGLEQVEVTRWGYAVEYDAIRPTQLTHSLEVRKLPGLFCAGQINGTTGYEEAAAQGFLAGVCAARSVRGEPAFTLSRTEAYLGVLVDDLVTRGVDEPYRMFTSRAEHRLVLRADNAHDRLLERADELGLVAAAARDQVRAERIAVTAEQARLASTKVSSSPSVAAKLSSWGSAPLSGPTTLAQLARRPELDERRLFELEEAAGVAPAALDPRVRRRAAIEVKYSGYIERANKEIAKQRALDDEPLPDDLFAKRLPGLSNEVYERLLDLRPTTLGQASRISGVTPAAIGLLAVELRRRARAS